MTIGKSMAVALLLLVAAQSAWAQTTETVSYLDENGVEQTVTATVLTGSTSDTTLGAGWYVVSSNISFYYQITIDGDVRLILSDSNTMTVSTDDSYAIYLNGHLTIYGQTYGIGTLNADGYHEGIGNDNETNGLTINGGIVNATGSGLGINCENLTINGGTVNATSNGAGITCGDITINGGTITAEGEVGIDNSGSVIINGGTVTGNGTDIGIAALETVTITGGTVTATGTNDAAIYGYEGVIINDGTVSATGSVGIYSGEGNIVLSYANAMTSIYASSLWIQFEDEGYAITIADGKTFTDGTGIYDHTTPSATLAALTDVTLQPSIPVSLTLVQGTKEDITGWWGTFYPGGNNYVLGEGAAAYTMDASRHLYRLGTDGRTVPAGQAVVIIATEATPVSPATSPATATIPLYNIGNNTLAVTDHAPGGNILQGSNSDVQVTDGQVDSQTPCVLSVVNGVVGFYPVATNYNGVIPANKAYYLTTP